MSRDRIEVSQGNRERRFFKCYLDFIDCGLLTGEEKLVFLILKRFLDVKSDQGEVFPSLETIAKLTGMTEKTIRKHIKSLQKKGVVSIQRRGLTRSNLYIIKDKADMWKSQTIEELQTAAEETGLDKAIRMVEAAGGVITFPDKEKGLRSDAIPTKVATELSTHSKNHLVNNPTGKKGKSQDEKITFGHTKKNGFHNFDQRDYDYDDLEKKLAGRRGNHE